MARPIGASGSQLDQYRRRLGDAGDAGDTMRGTQLFVVSPAIGGDV
ncbi:MAG: hypothetical protein ACK5OC_26650 [Pirellula sp.]